MRDKSLLLIFVVFLIFTLAGCSGIVTPPLHNAEDILRTVDNYLLALSNREYELAKTYCIPDGNAYQTVEVYQGMPYFDSSTLVFSAYLNYVETSGNISEMNINLTLTATVCFEDICSSESETLNNYSMYLSKINEVWRLN